MAIRLVNSGGFSVVSPVKGFTDVADYDILRLMCSKTSVLLHFDNEWSSPSLSINSRVSLIYEVIVKTLPLQ